MSTVPDALHLLQSHDPIILLDTARPDKENFTSLLFIDPVHILQIHHINELPSLLVAMEDFVRCGYFLAGYYSYECGYFIEKLGLLDYTSARPLAWFGVYRQPITSHTLDVPISNEACTIQDLRFDLDETTYHSYLERIHEHICAGNIYQVNFTGRYRFRLDGSPLALYTRLRRTQPTPYSAYLRIGSLYILSLSPELFFRLDKSCVTARPMKGTAPRGYTPTEDVRQATWLYQDPKNRAENVMITDLLRNDLGRICTIGSIAVPHLFSIERYDTLFQMTSTVTGTLMEGTGLPDLFRSLFPCGSVVGAPKIKAMEIIHQLESSPRGIYTGAIGYIAPGRPHERRAVFNVSIRTLTLESGHGEMGIGSGIVHDSNPTEEYAECMAKARFLTILLSTPLLSAPIGTRNPLSLPHLPSGTDLSPNLPDFTILETFLWDGNYQHLERHLARMAATALHFGYPFKEAQAHSCLNKQCANLQPGRRYKVRLTLNRQGILACENILLLEQSPGEAVVVISTEHTDSHVSFYYHKTTYRPLYDHATHFAQMHGLADVLFLNERDELTEGAISNIFIARDGLLLTPPINCGLLNGVYRQYLLDERPHTSEAVLTLHDLLAAEQVYICNSVRGLLPVAVCSSPCFPP